MTTDASVGTLSGLHCASMITSDGVRLDADVWTPKGQGPFPVLLMRQSYGRRLGSSLCYAHPAWYARQGFMVVVQDVRGRGTSEGVFEAFVHEGRDGAETIAWAAGLPGSNGRVGMFGFSYQGTNQLLAVGQAPEALKAVAPAMFGWDLHADWATEGDAFRLRPNIGWALQMGTETARLQGDEEGWTSFYAAARSLPLDTRVNSRPPVFERRPDLSHYHDWIDRPAGDPYWRAVSPRFDLPVLAARDIPALLVGGWFDSHLPGTLAAFDDMTAAGMSHVHLAVGPWTHFPWDRRVGELDFGPKAVTAIDLLLVRWFSHWLSAEPSGASDAPRLSLFQMHGDGWLEREGWPQTERLFHLDGSGRASIDQMDGRLEDVVPAEIGSEFLVHDPWRPAPTVGGAFGMPPGPVNRAATDARNDVLTFTTAPLVEALDLGGPVAVSLRLEADSPSFDLACVLSRVTTDGRVYQLAEGYRRVDDHRALSDVRVSLRATCARLAKGERLRLSIAPASYPAYPVNPGAERSPTETARSQADIITLAVRTGGDHGSRLIVGLT